MARPAAAIALALAAALAVGAGRADDSMARAMLRDFDAAAQIPCAQERGQQMTECRARVARTGGAATVEVTFPNGFARRLSFAGGAFVRASTTMSGTGRDIDWQIEGGTYLIRVDDQRFELPVDLVTGP